MGEAEGAKRSRGLFGALTSVVVVLVIRRARRIVSLLFQARSRPMQRTKGDQVRALAAQMTERPGQNEWTTPPHDPEHIRWKLVAIVTAIALSFYTIGTILAWFQLMILQGRRRNPIPDQIGANRINMLIQPIFDLETASYEQHRLERLRLSSYGWSDRRNQMIHIPVERAIEELVAEHEGKGRGQEDPP